MSQEHGGLAGADRAATRACGAPSMQGALVGAQRGACKSTEYIRREVRSVSGRQVARATRKELRALGVESAHPLWRCRAGARSVRARHVT